MSTHWLCQQAFKAQLRDRRFQAGFKAWLAATVALVVIAAACTHLLYLGRQGASIFMFGFLSLVFTMRERVESSMEMVIFRVGATVVGACVGHMFIFNPVTAYNPYILGSVNIFFCLLLVPFSIGQSRLVVVLALLTFTSVTACQYVGCCGAVGSITYLVGRILATGGGSLFAMLINRLLWPWRRNRWAMEELSRASGIAVIAVTKMYNAEHQHLAAAARAATPAPTPAAGTSRRTSQTYVQQQSQGHVAISMSDSEQRTNPDVPQHANKDNQANSTQRCTAANAAGANHQAAAAAAGACGDSAAGDAAAAAITGDPALVTKSPEQLQQMMGTLLMPVQVSIARDTWVTWKKGALALTPSVPLMMLAVQQLLDALLALGITHKLLFNQQPQQSQPQQHEEPLYPGSSSTDGDTSPRSSDSESDSSSRRSPAECMQWQQELLLQELVQPIHSSFCKLLGELAGLVVLVQQHVRQPTAASRAALKQKIQEVHDMRVSVSLEYIQLRNQRHRKMGQQLSALWNHQQQQHRQGQQPADNAAEQPGASSGVPTVPASGAPLAAALQPGLLPAAAPASLTAAAAGVGGAAGDDGAVWCVQQPGFQHQVLSTVQYMAFVHAMRRCFDRAVAVARCAADARF